MRRVLVGSMVAAAFLATPDVRAQEFSFLPPGDLPPGSGTGRVDETVFAPTMLFPMQQLPAFANSQVWGNGGNQGPGGGQCDAENYSYPWRDNYCESRSWDMPLCPSGTGHQGQDIRAATCERDIHPIVAAEDGTITNIGSYSVYLTAADGTRFDYLHMSNVTVSVGQDVKRGDVLGMVSNEFGGTPTTIHLHFNIRQNVAGVGTVYVPPYMSLVNAYQRLLERPIDGALEVVTCDALVGWAFDPDDREAPADVPFVFDASGVAHDVRADVYRGDLCENIGFCEHGFDVAPPYSLFDGAAHEVDATNGEGSLAGSPLSLQCDTPLLAGVRRPVSANAYGGWGFSAFWDEPPVAEAEVEALSVGGALPEDVVLRRADDDFFVVDGEQLRPISDRGMRAWHLSPSEAEAGAGDMAVGDDWPERPLVMRDADGAFFVLDAEGAEAGSTGSGGTAEVAPPVGEEDSGCGCEVVGVGDSSAKLGWAFAALWLLSRRRRNRPT